MEKIVESIKNIFRIVYILLLKPKALYQLFDTKSIPIIIINFNQLFFLEQLVNFLLDRKFKNIVIIDNNSNYPPLLKYYNTIKDKVIIEKRNDNLGHMVFFKDPKYLTNYGKGFYVITDADILPNKNLPPNFLFYMIKTLFANYRIVNKVGFALNIEDIPSYYPLRDKVLSWEKKFWSNEIKPGMYLAEIDTTFALYKPGYKLKDGYFLSAIRISGDYCCLHGGWYLNPKNISDENQYFMKTVNSSSSWMIDELGNSKSDMYDNI